MKERVYAIYPLLGDLADVPSDYISDVSRAKRFMERWVMDPDFRCSFADNADSAIASLGIALPPEQLLPLINGQESVPDPSGKHCAEIVEPASVQYYRAFIQEKREHRIQMRADGEPSDVRMAAWRRRQVSRCIGELGQVRAEGLVHAPAAFELSKGCTVGCWFCGVAAPKFDHTWPYTEETGTLWRAVLATLGEVIGDCARQGFLYWATDPLDNPDYERFLVDFHRVLGRCPQTTTALAHKDIDRTRRLLRLSHSLDSTVDRFSIISLNSLYRIHEAFSPEELLRVEFVPQNREVSGERPKSNAGRARKFAHKRQDHLVPEGTSSTIACLSGFLFNMIDRSVQLITPCAASDRWPLGYWVLDRGSFGTPEELRTLLKRMITDNMRASLRIGDPVCLRPDLRVEVSGDEVRATSIGQHIAVRKQPRPDELASLLQDGSFTAGEIALRREKNADVPLTETFTVLDHLFAGGALAEEPPAPAADPGRAELTIAGTT